MAIVAGFDVHRSRITFDALDAETGEVQRGRIPADREPGPQREQGTGTRLRDAGAATLRAALPLSRS
jgi:hypothetical protein